MGRRGGAVFVLGVALVAGCHLIYPFGVTTEAGSDAGADALADGFHCNDDGSATWCAGGECQQLGACPLGCDAQERSCRVPSNVAASLMTGTHEDLKLGQPTTIDTDSRKVVVEGVDKQVSFVEAGQQQGGGKVGVLRVKDLGVAAGVTVTVKGALPLVILATGKVTIDGTIDVGAVGPSGGPGGGDGGKVGADGQGPCPGKKGAGADVAICPKYCVSGGGGGGHAGVGGKGGAVDFDEPTGQIKLNGGAGGGQCGSAALTPLVGGSGGAGGSKPLNSLKPSTPGPGGGGGGAVQITAAGGIAIGGGGGITAPGAGGGKSISGGGAGGGSGGAILLEAPQVTLADKGFLTANGGGGGGGDCT